MMNYKMAQVDLVSDDPCVMSESRSGLVFSKSLMRQRWRATVTFSPTQNASAQALFASLVAMQGTHRSGKIRIPLLEQHPNMTGAVTVSGSANAGAEELYIDNYSGEFTTGGAINIAGHNKMYLIVSQIENLIMITPPLRKSVNNAAINYTEPTLTARRNKDEIALNVKRQNSQISAEFIEELD